MFITRPPGFLPAYPTPNDWRDDWVWPATLFAGIAWSVGFLLAGMAWYYFARSIFSFVALHFFYAAVLYG
jgi:hypothetical protein